jgi:hypothetical protein
MLKSFADPYDDELLYSAIARYHSCWSIQSYKEVLKNLFGSDSIVPTIGFPSHLDYLSKQFTNKQYADNNYFLYKHTLLPIYIPFLTEDRRNKIINDMKYSDGKGIYTILGLAAGGICKKEGLFYCPLCVSADIKTYGEAYFHRIHQVQGVEVCSEHGCLLRKYEIDRRVLSRLQFIRLDYRNIDYNAIYETNEKLSTQLLLVAQSVKYILNSKLLNFNINKVFDKYTVLLKQKQLLTVKGAVKQKQLYEEFKGYYSNDLLDTLQSNFQESDESSWLKNITRKQRKIIHPIRHILFIQFLCGSVERFFEKAVDFNPFGNGPWLCLNSVADHYMKRVINNCVITSDYVTRKPVGTFSCSCGFVYTRKGPDKTEEDELKIGRIKNFGELWENKLKFLVEKQKYSLRGIAILMKCDPKTIVKYAERNGTLHLLNTSMRPNKDSGSTYISNCGNDYSMKYSEDFLNLMKIHPELSRTELRNTLKKQYAWFYRNDKQWLENNLPKSLPVRSIVCNSSKVNWENRDAFLLHQMEEVYNILLKCKKPVRITKSMLGKMLGKSALLDNYLEKLPNTEKYMRQIIETVEDFQIRRVNLVCERLYAEKGLLTKWEIIRLAGLKDGCSSIVEDKINANLEKYN